MKRCRDPCHYRLVRRLELVIVTLSLSVSMTAWASSGEVTTEGRSAPRTEVVGGAQVAEGSWPDAAGVMEGNSVVCTGVLVAPNLVLTAGHCSGDITAVILGTNDYTTGGEIINVTREIAYPRWWQSYDAAILVLERDATIAPRTIADGCIRDTYTVDGAAVAIVGYGAIDEQGRRYTSELREAFTTVTDADCSAVERGCVSSISPGGEIGAGGMGIDSCYGDSGGPLYLLTPSGDFLVGLTSRAWDDVRIDCAEGGIYVRPDALIPWIETETGVDLPEATCNLAPLPTAAEHIVTEVGSSGSTSVTPNDPDAGDTHTYAIGQQPAHGTAEVSPDGVVTFTSTDDFVGADQLTVSVTDSGSPGLTGEVVVLIEITEGGGCGCRSTGAGSSGSLLLLGVVMLALRRRSKA